MKIISLNAWHGTRNRELRDFLAEHVDSTDVFCFQESDGEEITQIFHDVLPSSLFHEVGSVKTSCKTPDSLTTFVRNGIEIEGTEVLLNDTADEAGYSYVTRLRVNNEHITVANTHGAAYPGDKLDTPGRIMQSKVIIDALSRYGTNVVVCGDFNLEPSTESVHLFDRAGYVNLVSEYGVATTRNELAWNRFPDRKQLFADYVFVSPETPVRGFSVPHNLASDHLPLIIDVDIDEAFEGDSVGARAEESVTVR